MSFEIGIEIQCFDEVRHKLCNRPMHNDMTDENNVKCLFQSFRDLVMIICVHYAHFNFF